MILACRDTIWKEDTIMHKKQKVSPAESAAAGKALRKQVSRSSHGAWTVAADRPDIVDLLKDQEKNRIEELIPIRHDRMSVSPFTFYRGNALGMACDLSTLPSTGQIVQACGDAHIANFGGFSSPARRLVFDINDFDETLPAPWEWDVKRLVASVEICGRDRGFDTETRTAAVRATICKYREAMRAFAERGTLDTWYANLDVAEILHSIEDRITKHDAKSVRKSLAKAAGKTSEGAVAKLTHVVDGRLVINSQPPLLEPIEDLLPALNANQVEKALDVLLIAYKKSLTDEKRFLIDQYTPMDIGRKVVGVGSVGSRAWIVVLAGRDEHDPLVLQIKEAEESVLERYLKPSAYHNHGERVVQGQRLLQTVGDILLGWIHGPALDGKMHDFYIRQLWDLKMSPDLDAIDAEGLVKLSALCGQTLAHAHARSGDRIAIAAYLGGGEAFDDAMVEFAQAYADQNEADYSRFMEALAGGEFKAREKFEVPEILVEHEKKRP